MPFESYLPPSGLSNASTQFQELMAPTRTGAPSCCQLVCPPPKVRREGQHNSVCRFGVANIDGRRRPWWRRPGGRGQKLATLY